MLDSVFGWRYLFFRRLNPCLGSCFLPIVIKGDWSCPQQIAINFQRPPVLVVDENADGQTMYIFQFKHSGKPFLNQRPYKIRLMVLNFYLFRNIIRNTLDLISLDAKYLFNLFLVNFDIILIINLGISKQLNKSTIKIIPICKNWKQLLSLESLCWIQKFKFNPTSTIHSHDLYLSFWM